MRYDIRRFYRPVCSYPDCGEEYDADENLWWDDPYDASESMIEDDWLVLDGARDEPVAICPQHLYYHADGTPVLYDPGHAEPDSGELEGFYERDGGEALPLPEPDCERGVLQAMLHSGLELADRPFLLPVCEYPHCGRRYHDRPFGDMWYPDMDTAETAVHDSYRWAMPRGDDGECHAFCPLHVMHDDDGRPIRIADTIQAPVLAERCPDPRLPAVRDDCVDGVMAVLRGEAE